MRLSCPWLAAASVAHRGSTRALPERTQDTESGKKEEVVVAEAKLGEEEKEEEATQPRAEPRRRGRLRRRHFGAARGGRGRGARRGHLPAEPLAPGRQGPGESGGGGSSVPKQELAQILILLRE